VVEDEESPESHEIICHQKNGLRFPALLVRTPLGLEGQRPIAVLYFIKDISESANYQEMILKLDRNASRGKMARSIAHEINNYLAILQGNLELVPMFLASNKTEKLESKLEIMKETVSKISNFTGGLTRFSNETPEYSKEDLNQLIENLIAFLKPQNKYDNIRIDTKLADDVPLVEIDSGQIHLLLVNLINNAAEAQADLNQDMWIEVTTAIDHSSKTVSIKVTDGGPGVDERSIPDLFIKRFSTRREGAGLGLITSKSVVDNHRGHLIYRTDDSSKAVFEVIIPVSRPVDEETEAADDGIQSVPVQ
jgi:two-component system sporulation sensor kinase A